MTSSSRKRVLTVLAAIFLLVTWATYSSNMTAVHLHDFESEFDTEPDAANETDTMIQRRLRIAESNWVRSKVRQQEGAAEAELQYGLDSAQGRILWDFFYPSFDCPFAKERIGRLGDGGKWICGFDQLISKKNCIIFSFGVRDDTSFEDEILSRTQSCVVHLFDPTIRTVPPILDKYPSRAFFHLQGISSYDRGTEYRTLKTIMTELKVLEIDVFKMDVEGDEWNVMSQIVEDFPSRLPFAQAQIEVHLNSFGSSDWLEVLKSWWDPLEKAGLRQFFSEPNLLNEHRYEYRELAFVNVKVLPFRLTSRVRRKQEGKFTHAF